MSALSQINQTEELTWLRRRVAELERDAHERVSIAAALEESRCLFDVFLSNTPALAWMKDELGRYVYANRPFHQLIEETGATCLGSTDQDLWPSELANQFRHLDEQAVSGGLRSTSATLPLAAGDRHFRILRFPFRARSGRMYAGGIALDETPEVQLEQAQNRCHSFFHSSLTGMMECEGDLVIDANDLLLSWLSLTRENVEARRVNWRDFTPASFHLHDDLALEELREDGACRPYEKEFLRGGETVPVIVSLSRLEKSTGRFVCFVQNISDRKLMEARLLRSQKLESLGLIAGGVAHDFNNLLATIMGNASLSMDAISREHPAFRSLNEVVVASRRASDLTQQVLAYSGRANFQIQPVNLSASVREIGSLLETTISKKITLRFDLARGLPLIEGDEGQLQQVIMNLVINASDAIGEQSGEIVVTTRSSSRNVCFEVRDTGCGMNEETKARIFDPFFTTKADGRGLGLAAVLGIVRNHRGALMVDSQMGIGTTFRVMFPASSAQPVPEIPIHPRHDLWGSETVLVVDDDEGIRRMSRIALERFGYKVLMAENGAEAVRAFADHHEEIAAVVLDWAMPVMNGDEALEQILAIDPNARVLMSSGYAETETLQRLNTNRLAGFVQKPYTTTKLAERLREVIGSRNANVCSQSSAGTRAGA